jgi:hypothetical protein
MLPHLSGFGTLFRPAWRRTGCSLIFLIIMSSGGSLVLIFSLASDCAIDRVRILKPFLPILGQNRATTIHAIEGGLLPN